MKYLMPTAVALLLISVGMSLNQVETLSRSATQTVTLVSPS
jgi:hypothetical protein